MRKRVDPRRASADDDDPHSSQVFCDLERDLFAVATDLPRADHCDHHCRRLNLPLVIKNRRRTVDRTKLNRIIGVVDPAHSNALRFATRHDLIRHVRITPSHAQQRLDDPIGQADLEQFTLGRRPCCLRRTEVIEKLSHAFRTDLINGGDCRHKIFFHRHRPYRLNHVFIFETCAVVNRKVIR